MHKYTVLKKRILQLCLLCPALAQAASEPDPIVATASVVSSTPGFEPETVLDGDLSTRWTGFGPNYMQFDLGDMSLIREISLAKFRGDERMYTFNVEISLDATNWVSVLDAQSSGTTLELEAYDIPDTFGRYIRINGTGSNVSEWNSYSEFAADYVNAVSYWPLNDGNPPIARNLSNGVDGTLNSGTLAGSRSVLFDGEDGRVDIGNVDVTAKTVAFWVNLPETVTASSSSQVLFRYGNNIGQDIAVIGSFSNFATNETLGLSSRVSNFERTYIRDVLNAGWHFVAFVWDDTAEHYRIVVDGQERTTFAATNGLHTHLMQVSDLSLGGSAGAALSNFNGSMAHFSVFDCSLSDTELEELRQYSINEVVNETGPNLSLGDSLAIDFQSSTANATPGTGSQVGFNVIEYPLASGPQASRVISPLRNIEGNTLADVNLDISSFNGGGSPSNTLGYGQADVGSYAGTLFTDRVFHDGISIENQIGSEVELTLTLGGLDDNLLYEVQLLTTAPAGSDDPVSAWVKSASSIGVSVSDVRNSQGPVQPLTLPRTQTDGQGNLVINVDIGGDPGVGQVAGLVVTAVDQNNPFIEINGTVVNFTEEENYISGGLFENRFRGWSTGRFLNERFPVDPVAGIVTTPRLATTDAIYEPGSMPIDADEPLVTYVDIVLRELASNRALSSNSPVFGLEFSDALLGSNALGATIMRYSEQEFGLVLAGTEPDSVPAGQGEGPRFDLAAVGITRGVDRTSDDLRFVIQTKRGADNTDWSFNAWLYNMSGETPELITTLRYDGGIAFDAEVNLYPTLAGKRFFPASGGTTIEDVRIHSMFYITPDRAQLPVPPLLTSDFPLTDPSVPGPGTSGPADFNNNGVSDVEEIIDPLVATYTANDDADGDGQSNLDEIRAGSDHRDGSSRFAIQELAEVSGSPDNLNLTFSSRPGVRYRVEMNETLEDGNWETLLEEVTATDSQTAVSIAMNGFDADQCFFRASLLPSADTDTDGLEDSLEIFLGFDPDSNVSARAPENGGDYQQYLNLLQGASPNGGTFQNSGVPGIPSDVHAARFLNQASFGATREDIEELQALGTDSYRKWIDAQQQLPANFNSPYMQLIRNNHFTRFHSGMREIYPANYTIGQWFNSIDNFNTVWYRIALLGDDQLRQRMAWGLSQILVIGPRQQGEWGHVNARWYDYCIEHAFGNYRDLLYDVTLYAGMGEYLSSLNNQKGDPNNGRRPDENFAREIMQLFTIGLFELNMDGTYKLDSEGQAIPTYSNEDIVQLARVFTGFILMPLNANRVRDSTALPMLMDESRHDVGGPDAEAIYGFREKRFLQGQFYSPPALPDFADDPGRGGLDDVNDAIDILFNHPNVPPFISYRLIQHMVTSNPSPAYVERVANVFADDGTGTRGNLGAVVEAILLDEEARSLSPMLRNETGRLKEPILRMMSMGRLLKVGRSHPSINDFEGIQVWRNFDLFSAAQQAPGAAPSVFNFYLPEYSHPGVIADNQIVSPEFQILNSETSVGMTNFIKSVIDRETLHVPRAQAEAMTPSSGELDFSALLPFADNTRALMDEINCILCQGLMHHNIRSAIMQAVDQSYPTNGTASVERVKLALYLTMTSTSGVVLK